MILDSRGLNICSSRMWFSIDAFKKEDVPHKQCMRTCCARLRAYPCKLLRADHCLTTALAAAIGPDCSRTTSSVIYAHAMEMTMFSQRWQASAGDASGKRFWLAARPICDWGCPLSQNCSGGSGLSVGAPRGPWPILQLVTEWHESRL